MKKRRIPPPPPDKPVKFIPCSEFRQIFNYQRTNKKAKYKDDSLPNIKS